MDGAKVHGQARMNRICRAGKWMRFNWFSEIYRRDRHH